MHNEHLASYKGIPWCDSAKKVNCVATFAKLMVLSPMFIDIGNSKEISLRYESQQKELKMSFVSNNNKLYKLLSSISTSHFKYLNQNDEATEYLLCQLDVPMVSLSDNLGCLDSTLLPVQKLRRSSHIFYMKIAPSQVPAMCLPRCAC